MLAAILAAYLAAAPLDPPHAAVLAVISTGEDAGGCDAAQKRKAAASATMRTLGRLQNDPVVLALVADPCICGASNCPYYAIRLTAGKPRVLLSTYAITVRDADRARPLPGLVVDAHDSAMVMAETRFAFRGGTYVAVANDRVRATDHARKPNAVPVHFAAGSSSAQLRGTASLGWFDAYTFDAAKGQRVTIDAVRSPVKLTLMIFSTSGVAAEALRPGVAFTLPATGSYQLNVENGSDSDLPYALRLTIR
jgi:hypothetical protein